MNDIELPEGAYWREYIKRFLREPEKRLALALRHLPERKAFAEAATALRAIITAKRRDKADFEAELQQLYRLAAQASFLFDTWEIEGVGMAEDVFLDLPREVWESLPMPYDQLGFRKLSLLTNADGKLLRQHWGQPQKHQSAQLMHLDAWEAAVEAYCQRHGL